MAFGAGDSITIAPAQTLTDKEYQRLRDAAVAIIREMGVECGGSNVQVGACWGWLGSAVTVVLACRPLQASLLSSKAPGMQPGHCQQQACSQVCLVLEARERREATPASRANQAEP